MASRASNLPAMASNLLAMASNLQPTSNGLQPNTNGLLKKLKALNIIEPSMKEAKMHVKNIPGWWRLADCSVVWLWQTRHPFLNACSKALTAEGVEHPQKTLQIKRPIMVSRC